MISKRNLYVESFGDLKLKDDYLSYYVLMLEEDNFDYFKSYLIKHNIKKYFPNRDCRLGDYVFIPRDIKIIHIVKPFETIEGIAKKYSKDKNVILKNNNIKSIFVGQQLNI